MSIKCKSLNESGKFAKMNLAYVLPIGMNTLLNWFNFVLKHAYFCCISCISETNSMNMKYEELHVQLVVTVIFQFLLFNLLLKCTDMILKEMMNMNKLFIS